MIILKPFKAVPIDLPFPVFFVLCRILRANRDNLLYENSPVTKIKVLLSPRQTYFCATGCFYKTMELTLSSNENFPCIINKS